MKIASQSLESKPEVSTGNPTPRQPYTKPYAPNEVSIRKIENHGLYPKEAKTFVVNQGFAIDLNLKTCIEKRAKGEKVLTPREADIAYRGKLDLKPDGLIYQSLMVFNGLIVEGEVGMAGNPFELRQEYNKLVADYKRGKTFKKSEGYTKSSQERKEQCDKKLDEIFNKMLDILAALNEMALPAHDHEVENGFPVEITIPEFMNFDQYRAAASKRVTYQNQ